MKIFTKYLLLIACSVLFFMFIGCKKKTHSKLVGSWSMVKFDKYDYPYIGFGKVTNVTYIFQDGDMMIRDIHILTTAGSDSSIKDTGYYYVQISKFKTYIKMVQLDSYDYNGLWWINSLDSKMLAIQRTETIDKKSGAYLRSEFLKK